MSFVNYQRTGDTVEITIRDHTGAKIEKHVCNAQDKKKYKSILKYLDDKYGFSPEIDVEDTPQYKDNEMDWWR